MESPKESFQRDAAIRFDRPKFIWWAKEIEALDPKSPRRREPQRFKWDFPQADA